MTALKITTATTGPVRKRKTARIGRDQPPASTDRVTACPDRPGSAVQQRLPGRARHHQRRRGEHQQQVLHHVNDEVGARPVVDRRIDRDQQHPEAAVEPERPDPPFSRPLRPGPPGQPPEPDLVPDHDDGHDDHERVERPVVQDVAACGGLTGRGLAGRAELNRHADGLRLRPDGGLRGRAATRSAWTRRRPARRGRCRARRRAPSCGRASAAAAATAARARRWWPPARPAAAPTSRPSDVAVAPARPPDAVTALVTGSGADAVQGGGWFRR